MQRKAFFEFFVIDRIATTARLLDFRAQRFGRGDGAMRKLLKSRASNDVVDPVLGKKGQHRLAHRCAVHGIAGADARNHAH